MNKTYMNEAEAAEYLTISVHKLRKDRMNSVGLPYSKLGDKVVYTKEDLDSWVEINKINPEK